MNPILLIIVIILLIGVIVFQILKRITINVLSKSIRKKDFSKTMEWANKPLSRKLLTPYICDLHKVRALYMLGDDIQFKEQIDEMLMNQYNDSDEKNFCDIYFHIFLDRDDKEYANKFMEKVKATNDPKFIKYNEQAYEVMINKKTDLIELMNLEMETDKYFGFPLGVVVYMIAKQYQYLGDKENAINYYESSLTCFPGNSFYASKAKKTIEQLRIEHDKRIADLYPN